MRIQVFGDNDCARVLRGLLRQADFAVTTFVPGNAVIVSDYVIYIEEQDGSAIHLDSIDCELEQNVLRHISQISKRPILVDRPGGQVHSDRELRILVPRDVEQQQAVEFGVLRGLIDTFKMDLKEAPKPPKSSFWRKIWTD